MGRAFSDMTMARGTGGAEERMVPLFCGRVQGRMTGGFAAFFFYDL